MNIPEVINRQKNKNNEKEKICSCIIKKIIIIL